MKKIFKIAFSCLALCFFGCETAQADSAAKKVFLIVWDGCEEACRGFGDYLKTNGTDVSFVWRDAAKDPEKLKAIIREIPLEKPSLVATWGTMATLEVFRRTKNGMPSFGAVPGVFMVVSQPVESGLIPSTVSQGRNLTGVTHLVPVTEQMQFARQMLPFRRVGIIYNPSELNSTVVVEQLRKTAAMMNFETVEKPLPMNDRGKPDEYAVAGLVAEMAEKKVDLIYLGPDAFMNAHRKTLSDTATAFNIPVMSAAEGAVRSNDALFAFVHRYYTVGQFAAAKALKILKDGIQAYDIPVEAPQRPLAVVNMTVAQKLNVYPPLSLIQSTDMINVPEK